MGKVLRVAAVVIGCALLALVGLAIWLHYYHARSVVTIYLTSAVPFALVAGIVAVALFLAARGWWLLVPAFAVLAALLWTQLPLWRAAPAAAGPQLTMMSSNLMMGAGDVGQLSAIAAAEKVDLLSVQELTPEAMGALQAAVSATLPYSYAVPGPMAAGTGLFSRFPLREASRIDGLLLGNIVARVDLPNAPATWVAAVHPIAPLGADIPARWNGELARLAGVLHALPGRVLAAGDFNATWDHPRYRDFLTVGFGDAVDQAGAGWKFTFPTDKPGRTPAIGIDHVIARGFVATQVRTFTITGSDHRAMMARLGKS